MSFRSQGFPEQHYNRIDSDEVKRAELRNSWERSAYSLHDLMRMLVFVEEEARLNFLETIE
jgi:hypothetical protein